MRGRRVHDHPLRGRGHRAPGASRAADRLGRVPLGWFTARSSGRVKRLLLDDVHALHHLVAHVLNDLVAATVTPLLALGYLFWVDWRPTLLAITPLPLYVLAYGWMMRDGRAKIAAWSRAVDRINSAAVELRSGRLVGASVPRDIGRRG
nr:ABC transporter transmembrane domain-containing protein [Embleya scabrispora]